MASTRQGRVVITCTSISLIAVIGITARSLTSHTPLFAQDGDANGEYRVYPAVADMIRHISHYSMTPTVASIQKVFLSSPRYAVVGASKDQSKYGTKVRTIIYGPPTREQSAHLNGCDRFYSGI
jgi:hypothetical protein